MQLKDLKSQIENKTVNNDMIIFLISDSNFIAKQYIREIAKIHNKEISNVDELPRTVNDLFGYTQDDNIKIYETDKLDKIEKQDNLYVITKKVSDKIKDDYSGYIVQVPKLENWQIKDYVYSIAEGVNESSLEQLCDICHYDIYRLDNEVSKLKPFSEKERNIVFEEMIDDDAYSDITKYSIFDMSNAIIKKDISTIFKLYRKIESLDCEPLGLVTILYNNFKNILSIQCDERPSAEKFGMSEKQFYAIQKNNCGIYTERQLVDILEFLTGVDKKIKSGEIFTDQRLIDLIIIKVLSI